MVIKTYRVTGQVFSQIKERLDACLDHTEVAMHVLDDKIFNGLIFLTNRGVKIRGVTEVRCEYFIVRS
ncbi:MAG: hypothetical protein M3Y53_02905 [Thermoproteota archaeon]|nr:hypothetical protein [Thermoproteota archaeon]